MVRYSPVAHAFLVLSYKERPSLRELPSDEAIALPGTELMASILSNPLEMKSIEARFVVESDYSITKLKENACETLKCLFQKGEQEAYVKATQLTYLKLKAPKHRSSVN